MPELTEIKTDAPVQETEARLEDYDDDDDDEDTIPELEEVSKYQCCTMLKTRQYKQNVFCFPSIT